MYKHVPIVSAFMIAQGLLEVIAGGFALIYGALYGALAFLPLAPTPEGEKPIDHPEAFSALFGGVGAIVIVAAIFLAALGVLKIVAGAFNFRYRKRTLGLVAAFCAPVSAVVCYCAPTAIGLTIFALVVHLNPLTKRAFELGEQGLKSDDILRTMLGAQASA